MTVRRRIFPSAPLSLFYARCPFSLACNHFWLALTPCQYHHPRWRQSSTEIQCMSALRATTLLGWLFTSIYEKRAQK